MLPVHITPFLYENGRKNIRFCPFILILLITNTKPKISFFVRSHCSGSVKLIVEYWSVFKNFRFLCVHIDSERLHKPPPLWISTCDSVFENLRVCDVFVQINVNNFTKTEVLLSVFVQKRCCVNGASNTWMALIFQGFKKVGVKFPCLFSTSIF